MKTYLLLALFTIMSISTFGQPKKNTPSRAQTNTGSKNNATVVYDTLCESWTLVNKQFTNFDDYYLSKLLNDKYDNIFFIHYAKQTTNLYRLDKDSFILCNPVNEHIWHASLNKEGEMFVFVGPLYNRRYYQLQNGSTWIQRDSSENKKLKENLFENYLDRGEKEKNSPIPAELKYAYFVPYAITKNLMIAEDPLNKSKGCVFQYINNKWERYFSFFTGQQTNLGLKKNSFDFQTIVIGKTIYLMESGELWKNDGKLKIAEIRKDKPGNFIQPLFVGAENDRKAAESVYSDRIGIFEEGGKQGLKTREGKIVAYPVFDKITFEKVPNAPSPKDDLFKLETYMFHLVGQDMDFYCHAVQDNKDFLGGYLISSHVENLSEQCEKCKNTGKIIVTEKETKQKWVNAKTISTGSGSETQTHADIYSDKRGATVTTTRTHVTTKTIPGHYEDAGSGNIKKEQLCPACQGRAGVKRSVTIKKYKGATIGADKKKYHEHIYETRR